MTKKHTILALAALSLTLGTEQARAELLFYEPFDYPPGPLAGNGAWYAHGSAGLDPVTVTGEESLAWSGLPEGQGGYAMLTEGDEDLSHPIFPRTEDGVLYYSFIVRPHDQNGDPVYNLHLRGERYNSRFYLRKTGEGKFQPGAAMTAGRPYFVDDEFAFGESLFVVIKQALRDDEGDSLLEFYLNPDASGAEPEEANLTERSRRIEWIDQFAIRQDEGTGVYDLDELRIATSWEGATGRLPLSDAAAKAIREQARLNVPKEDRMLRHNSPGLVVDAMAGLWANPIPMDYDGDGDYDLVVSTRNRPSGGTYFFENDGSSVLRAPVLVAPAERDLTITHLPDGPVIMTPGTMYRDFTGGLFANPEEIDFDEEFYAGRSNQWSLADFDGDGVLDLIIGTDDWRDYGWDDAYDDEGRWTAGRLHGRVYWARNGGSDESPDYGKLQEVMAGGEPVDVYGFPSPNFIDWDEDGDLDLLCGEFLDRITYFENTRTRTAPEYAEGHFLEANGETIRMDLEMLLISSADWDGDGDMDLIVGEEDGRVALVENLPGEATGAPEYFRQRAEHVKPGALTTPTSVDWDGDGDDDIIAGNTAGYIEYVENLGGYPPSWAAPKRLEAGGETIRILAGESLSIQGPAEAKWGYTVVTSADWNMDGLPDLITNTIIGKIEWYRNIGTRTEPRMAPAEPIRVEWGGETPSPPWIWWEPEPGTLVTQWRTKPNVFDATGDGAPDLVIQDHEGYLSLFERVRQGDEWRLAPGRRVFKLTEEGVAYDNNNNRVFYDEDGDDTNDLSMRERDGSAVYFSVYPSYVSSERPLRSTRGEIRGEQAQRLVPPPADEAAALRTNCGWAGRSGRRKFLFTDWDGDGRIDILMNSYSISFFRNVGEEGEWLFEDVGPIAPDRLAGHTTCPEVVDWNGDGVTDLLIGAEDGHFYYYERSSHDEMTKALTPR